MGETDALRRGKGDIGRVKASFAIEVAVFYCPTFLLEEVICLPSD